MKKEIETYRKEIKYVIPKTIAYRIKKDLYGIMMEDNHNSYDGYLVRSLYFDSIDNIDYYSKCAGIEKRKKIRLRIYDSSSDICKLERKNKYSDNQCKQSLIISSEDAKELCFGNYQVLKKYDSDIAIEFYSTLCIGCYKPVTLIDYNRIAFAAPMYDIRVTIDSDIRTNESCFDIFNKEVLMTPRLLESSILEVKYSGKLLGYISDLLSKYNLSQSAYSKYIKGRTIYTQYI